MAAGSSTRNNGFQRLLRLDLRSPSRAGSLSARMDGGSWSFRRGGTIFFRHAGLSKLGSFIKWMTQENHQKRGNGLLKAYDRRLLRKKRKMKARRGTIYLRALIASKNGQKVLMEKVQYKNKKGECI